jgi:hypothetical protein
MSSLDRDDMLNHEVGWYADYALGHSRTNRWLAAERKIVRTPGDVEALHPLFLQHDDKRLLFFGYRPAAGITTLRDQADRIDAIRGN